MDLKKRIGPLPLWAWAGTLALGAFLLWRNLNAQSGSTTPQGQALSPYATPGFGLDPTTGMPYGSGGGSLDSNTGRGDDELLQAVSALIQGQAGLGEAIAGIPGQIYVPEPQEQPSLAETLGDMGMILDLVGTIGGMVPAGSARQRATGGGGRRGRPPAARARRRETWSETRRRLIDEQRDLRRGLRTARGRRARTMRARLQRVGRALRGRYAPRRTDRAPAAPNEQRTAAAPNHRAPRRPARRFRARTSNASREHTNNAGPTRARRAPTIHRRPVAQRSARMPAARRDQPRHVVPQHVQQAQQPRGGSGGSRRATPPPPPPPPRRRPARRQRRGRR